MPQFDGEPFCAKQVIIEQQDHQARAEHDGGADAPPHRLRRPSRATMSPGPGPYRVRPGGRSVRRERQKGDRVTPYIISGLVVGSIYAISALGLVLTYTSSRVFNFAHGAIAYGIAIFYYYLTTTERLEHRDGGAVHAPGRRTAGRPRCSTSLLFRRLTHSSPPPCAWCRPSGSGWRCRRSCRILFPFAARRDLQPARVSVEQPADPNFVKVFGTLMNTTSSW